MLVVAFVLELFAALSSNDSARVMALWSETSVERELVDVRLSGDFRVYCVSVRSFVIDDVSVDGDTATVRTAALVHREPRHGGGRPTEHLERRTIWLQRAANGWRVTKWRTAEQLVADQILAAGNNPAAVERILRENVHLVDVPLVEELVLAQDEDMLLNHRVYRPFAHAAMRVADMLGDPLARAMAIPRHVAATRGPDPAKRPAAIARLREALRLSQEIGDVDMVAAATSILSLYALDADESSAEAEEYLRWTLAHEQEIRSERTLQMARANLGALLFSRQDYAGSYAALEEVLAYSRRSDHWTHYYIGRIYEQQNDPELALHYYTLALSGARTSPTVALAHLGVASIHRKAGRSAEARKHEEHALELAREGKLPGLIARSLVATAETLTLDGQTDRALELLREGIANAGTAGYLPPHLDALLTIGRIQLNDGRNGQALATAAEVLKISDSLDFPGYERYAALMLRGRAHRALGDSEAALHAFEQAIVRLEAVRGAVAGAERQQRLFFEPFSAAYVEIVDLLLRRDRVGEALIYAERAKGRVLLDALQNGRRQEALSDADRTRREALVAALQRLNRRLLEARTRGHETVALERDVQKVQTDLDTFENELAVRSTARQRGGAATIDPAGLQRLVARDDVAYVEFVVHDRATYLFTVRRSGGGAPAVAVHRIAIDRATLEQRVAAFVGKLESRDLSWKNEARALYDLLIRPAAGTLRGVRAVGFVPDGVLWRLPMETLVDAEGRFLVERTACFYAPSLSVLETIASRKEERETPRHVLLAFGNPSIGDETRHRVNAVHRGFDLGPLPDAEGEVKEIERVYGAERSRVYIREAAVEERAKELMSNARVVHFATHGLLDDRNPMYSQLVLAQGSGEDGALQAWEMMRLDIGADLVVLSACDTARGKVGAGEGLIGMSWALFAGGCPSTVATLWKIGSESASALMVAFHQDLARADGDPYAKAQALREAQLRFIRNEKRRHPYYWSAFVLVGSPR